MGLVLGGPPSKSLANRGQIEEASSPDAQVGYRSSFRLLPQPAGRYAQRVRQLDQRDEIISKHGPTIAGAGVRKLWTRV